MRSYIIYVIYLFLVICAAARRNAYIRDGERKSFRIWRLIISVYEDLWVVLSRRADRSREINEAERSGRMRGWTIKDLSEISNHFSFFDYLRGIGGTCSQGGGMFFLYRLFIGFHIRSYTLFGHRIFYDEYSQINLLMEIMSQL